MYSGCSSVIQGESLVLLIVRRRGSPHLYSDEDSIMAGDVATVRPEAGGNDVTLTRGVEGTIDHQLVRSLEAYGRLTTNLVSHCDTATLHGTDVSVPSDFPTRLLISLHVPAFVVSSICFTTLYFEVQ